MALEGVETAPVPTIAGVGIVNLVPMIARRRPLRIRAAAGSKNRSRQLLIRAPAGSKGGSGRMTASRISPRISTWKPPVRSAGPAGT